MPTRAGRFSRGGRAAAAGAATLAMPNVARAQEAVTFKFQSTWPAKDIFHEFAADFVSRVNEMGGGKLKIDLLAAGAVAKALEVHDAVLAGTLDGGHGVTAYWYGKHKAYSLFGTPPAWGWRANQMIGWMKYGGGQALMTNWCSRYWASTWWAFSPARCRPSRLAGSSRKSPTLRNCLA